MALRLLLATDNTPASDEQIQRFLQFVEFRQLSLEHLYIVLQGEQLLWSGLAMINPGRTALLMLPSGFMHPAAAALLLETVAQWAGTHEIDLLQLLIDPHLHTLREVCESQRFIPMAELRYLQQTIRNREIPPQLPAGMSWETYSPQTHPRFAATILASYRHSLDCPALAGMRNVEDVIEGHKANGEFDPSRWFLLCRRGNPLAVLLLNGVTGTDMAEVTYLGVAEEARRAGLGTLLLRQATVMASQMKVKVLTLAVDAENHPALQLYYRHGFRHVSSKLAMMRDLRSCSPRTL